MAKNKYRVYYGNEENAYEIEISEFKSLEDAQKEFPKKIAKNFKGVQFHYTADRKGYNEIYAVAEQGFFRQARQPLEEARREIVAMFR
jgi:hypothetical protein